MTAREIDAAEIAALKTRVAELEVDNARLVSNESAAVADAQDEQDKRRQAEAVLAKLQPEKKT